MKQRWFRRAIVFALCAVLLATPCFATVGGATVKQISGGLNLRSQPTTASTVVEVLSSGDFLLVEEQLDGWYKVAHDGKSGYVSADFVSFDDSMDGDYDFNATTAGTDVNLRAGAATWCWLYKTISKAGTGLKIRGVTGNWLKVVDESGVEGYIRSDLVNYLGTTQTAAGTQAAGTQASAGTQAATPTPTAQVYTSLEGLSTGEQIANYAKQFVGYSYVWGGASPSTGFDCSGLVYYVYGQFGYKVERVAQNIYNSSGVYVSKDQMKPGDVLCFGYSAYSIGHVGIYVGDGKFVHASTYGVGVIVTELDSAYYTSRLMGIKRIVN